jgi:integrase
MMRSGVAAGPGQMQPAALAIAPTANHTEPDPPSAEEAAAVIGAAWGDPDWGSLLWVMMVSGMRRGQISALRWRHVDFATDALIVQRANAQPRSGVREKQTKTRLQRRIAIDSQTAAVLRAHRERSEQRCRLLGVVFRDDGGDHARASSHCTARLADHTR